MFLFLDLLFNWLQPITLYSGNGGGGSSGDISYPVYLENTHGQWLNDTHGLPSGATYMDYNIAELMNTAHRAGGNPYENETSFDPGAAVTPNAASPLGKIDTQFVASKTIMDALSTVTDWESYLDAAEGKYGKYSDIDFLDSLSTTISGLLSAVESALSSSSITNMVTSFENNKKVRYLRDVGMWSAGMADINAVHTSSFIMGLAVQQIEFSNSVDQYERELKANTYTTLIKDSINAYMKAEVLRVSSKDNLLVQAPNLMGSLEQLRISAQTQLTQIKNQIEQLTLIAYKEQNDRQAELEVDEATWDLEVYMYGGNVMSSITGASMGRKGTQMSKGQTALGGAFAGASIGAGAGSVVGIPGAVIGAAAGALLGWAY